MNHSWDYQLQLLFKFPLLYHNQQFAFLNKLMLKVLANSLIHTNILFLLTSLIFVTFSRLSSPVIQKPKPDKTLYLQPTSLLPYHELPIYGNASLGYYYVQIFIGSPNPQPQSVIIDTGSGILAVPGVQCKKCSQKHLDDLYDPNKSQSSINLKCSSKHPACQKSCANSLIESQCTFSISYAQGSRISGNIVQDDIRFETYSENEQIRANFGYINRQGKLFLTQAANGIFGLSPHRQSNILQKLIEKHSQKNQQRLIFSLCLGTNGGTMTVGGINQKINIGKSNPDITIPYNDRTNRYSLTEFKEIKMGDYQIYQNDNEHTQPFVDSGTTFTYFPSLNFKKLENKLNSSCYESGRCKVGRGEDSICYKLFLNQGQILQEGVKTIFPSIWFLVGDQIIDWYSTKYLLIRKKSENEVCLGILPASKFVLGANWMYSKNIEFDLQKKTLSIYNDRKCSSEDQVMGRYLEDAKINIDIEFMTPKHSKIADQQTPTSTITLIIFVFSLIVGVFFFIFLLVCFSKNQPSTVRPKQHSTIQSQVIQMSQNALN